MPDPHQEAECKFTSSHCSCNNTARVCSDGDRSRLREEGRMNFQSVSKGVLNLGLESWGV